MNSVEGGVPRRMHKLLEEGGRASDAAVLCRVVRRRRSCACRLLDVQEGEGVAEREDRRGRLRL